MRAESFLVFEREGLVNGVKVGDALFQIRVGNADRQWLEVSYIARHLRPIVPVTIVPAFPDDPDAMVDACLLYYPKHFTRCPSLDTVTRELRNRPEPLRGLDFHLFLEDIPRAWFTLREEARPFLDELAIFSCEFKPYELSAKRP